MIPRHVIITHFNIRWNVQNRNGLYKLFVNPPDKQWLEHRFELFSKYTYPSVCAQTNQNFDWFVYFDSNNTDVGMLKKFPRITPLFVPWHRLFDPRRDVIETLRRRNLLSNNLITTNLDNDDSLHNKYIEFIQDWYFEHKTMEGMFLLEFPLGLNFKHPEKQILILEEKYGHFMTMVEIHNNQQNRRDLNFYQTIRCMDHRRLQIYSKAIWTPIKTDEPMWIQVCHDRNAKNSFVVGLPTHYGEEDIKRMFNVTL